MPRGRVTHRPSFRNDDVAPFGLIAFRIPHAPSPPVIHPAGLIAAQGRRSLSPYLVQSIAWVLILAPYTLALGQRFGSRIIAAMGIALIVWLASVVAADALDRRSHPGRPRRSCGD